MNKPQTLRRMKRCFHGVGHTLLRNYEKKLEKNGVPVHDKDTLEGFKTFLEKSETFTGRNLHLEHEISMTNNQKILKILMLRIHIFCKTNLYHGIFVNMGSS